MTDFARIGDRRWSGEGRGVEFGGRAGKARRKSAAGGAGCSVEVGGRGAGNGHVESEGEPGSRGAGNGRRRDRGRAGAWGAGCSAECRRWASGAPGAGSAPREARGEAGARLGGGGTPAGADRGARCPAGGADDYSVRPHGFRRLELPDLVNADIGAGQRQGFGGKYSAVVRCAYPSKPLRRRLGGRNAGGGSRLVGRSSGAAWRPAGTGRPGRPRRRRPQAGAGSCGGRRR